jgi:GNAT superfamily N-acetyltransferase
VGQRGALAVQRLDGEADTHAADPHLGRHEAARLEAADLQRPAHTRRLPDARSAREEVRPAHGLTISWMAMLFRQARLEDVAPCVDLAEAVVGGRRAGPLVQAAADREQLLVALDDGAVVGTLAYRTDWFACTFVTLVSVASDWRRKGVARGLFGAVERRSPGARIFSSTEETNVAAIRMHRALGFVESGYIDNLPQGYRELLFYKRVHGALGAER